MASLLGGFLLPAGGVLALPFHPLLSGNSVGLGLSPGTLGVLSLQLQFQLPALSIRFGFLLTTKNCFAFCLGLLLSFAAGALLAMIADTMVPEAYEVEREWTGGLVVAGFALSLLIAAVLM